MASPLIGITKPTKGDNAAYALLAFGVRLAGGRPVAITPRSLGVLHKHLDGLLLGGGSDVFPMLFDDTPKQGYIYDRSRDEMEIRLAKTALDYEVPLLGVCRGAQLLNVAYGGTLHLNVAEAYEDANYPDSLLAKVFYRKPITTKVGSQIRLALGVRRAEVNSLHKQSVKKVGEGLIVTAREPNGVIQAIEDPSKPFVLGVQFHPEFMLHRAMFRNIFRRFVSATRETRVLPRRAALSVLQRVGNLSSYRRAAA